MTITRRSAITVTVGRWSPGVVHVRPRRSLSTRFPGWRGGLSAHLPIGGLGFESTRRASSQCLVQNTSAATRNCLPRRFLRAALDLAVALVPARRPSARLHRRVHGGPLCGTSPRYLPSVQRWMALHAATAVAHKRPATTGAPNATCENWPSFVRHQSAVTNLEALISNL